MGIRTAAESFEARLDRIREMVWALQQINGEEAELGLVHTFEDAVIARNYKSDKLYEMAYTEVEGDIIFGEPKEVDNLFVTKRLMAANPKMAMKGVSDLIDTFDDWAGGSFDTCVSTLSGTPGIDNVNALYAWLHYQALGKWPAEKAADCTSKRCDDAEITGPIVMKNAAKRIAYAAVLVPGELDHDGESVTKEKIEAAAHEWMESYQNVDLQHTLNNVGRPVESYLLPAEMTVKTVHGQEDMVLPEGTWILGSRLDEATWEAVEKGTLTGYSVMGMKRAAMKNLQEAIAAGKSTDDPMADAALKKTLLRDLGPDWVPVYVSVVNQPAVPKAKFFALKAKEEEPAPDTTLIGKILNALGKTSSNNPESAEKEGRRFAKATVDKLKAAHEALLELISEAEEEANSKKKAPIPGQKGGDSDMTEEEIKGLVESAVKESMASLDEKFAALEEAIKGQATEEPEENGDTPDEPDEPDYKAEYEALKSELTDKIEALAKKLGGTKATALKGQDGDDEGDEPAKKSAVKGRDAFGRKLHSA